VLAEELDRAGFFRNVSVSEPSDRTGLILEGDVRQLTLRIRPHFLGTFFFLGQILGQLGAPMGNWSVSQSLHVRLSVARTGKILWEGRFDTEAEGIIAAYYGKDPMRCGYPAAALMEPVVRKILSKTEHAIAARAPQYWQRMASESKKEKKEPKDARPRPTPPVTIRDSASVGVAIGISDYVFMGDIDVCASDAHIFASALTEARGIPPENVAVMTDDSNDTLMPSKEMIRERIRICAREARKEGLAFVFFSGHAVTRNGKLLLVPKDCRPENGIPVDEILQTLSRSKARDRILVVDACHAGAAQKGMGGLSPDLLQKRPEVTIFLSCDRDEFSYPESHRGHSVYTLRFVEALKNLGARGRAVTAQALHERVQASMRKWRLGEGKSQTPN
jgi:hypothetical protein